MQIEPYLFFNGRAAAALDFYRDALDAQVEMLMRYRDAPEPPQPGCEPNSPDDVLHASFRIGDTRLMASDGPVPGTISGFALSLSATDDTDARRKFDALAAGGQVQMPLGETFFASSFGMLVDRFGVPWMVVCSKPM